MKKKIKMEDRDLTELRQYSLVRFNTEPFKEHEIDFKPRIAPFTEESVFVFLGEIPNMVGHCVLIDQESGKILSGYHLDNFIEIHEDEV